MPTNAAEFGAYAQQMYHQANLWHAVHNGVVTPSRYVRERARSRACIRLHRLSQLQDGTPERFLGEASWLAMPEPGFAPEAARQPGPQQATPVHTVDAARGRQTNITYLPIGGPVTPQEEDFHEALLLAARGAHRKQYGDTATADPAVAATAWLQREHRIQRELWLFR